MTTRHLLTTAQMGALREVAMMGMTTPVQILRTAMIRDSSPNGDDLISETTVTTVNGWMYSTPTPERQQDGGSIITANTYRLFLPVGTDIRDGDVVVVSGDRFSVTDTDAESTWNPMLTITLRRRDG
jgi:hypothetical protein